MHCHGCNFEIKVQDFVGIEGTGANAGSHEPVTVGHILLILTGIENSTSRTMRITIKSQQELN